MTFITICFLLPALLTTRKKEVSSQLKELPESIEEAKQEEQLSKNNEPYEYKKYGTIKLLHNKTGEIEELPLDTYLYNVVSSEMPVDFELEALKAQSVVARTYTIYQISHSNRKHGEAEICDDSSCCQAWISKEERFERWDENVRESNWNKITQAVDSTAGKIITYNGEPIDAFFHSNSGGKTEIPVNVWGGSDFPYLQSVETAGEEGYTQYSSSVSLTKTDLVNKLKEKHPELEIDFNSDGAIKILELTDGNRVKTIKFGNIQVSGVEARAVLGLKSANFDVKLDGENVVFSVVGYGHGVGLSQTGSDSMAKSGSNYVDIIKHFYTGVEITEVN